MRVSDVTTQFPDKVAIQALIDELKAYADSIATGSVDLSDYVTKSELQAKLDALDINIDLSSYATKEELNTAINSIDLSSYAKKTEIPTKVSELENDSGYLTEHQDLSAYALKTEIPTVPSLDGYATTEYVDNAIANVPSGGGNVDLSNYYTKDETYSKTEVDTLVANSGGSSSGGSSDGASDVYSTEETAIGTWIDGSTIYRKVIEVGTLPTVSGGNYSVISTSILDEPASAILRITGIMKSSNTHFVVNGDCTKHIGSPSSTHSTFVGQYTKAKINLQSTTGKTIGLYYGTDWGGYNYTLIVEYTKSA